MTPKSFTIKVQTRLRDKGFYKGELDGEPGIRTLASFDQALPSAVQTMNITRPDSSDETLVRFQTFLTDNNIRHFTAAEVFYLGGSNGRLRLNHVPASALWPNIIPTLAVLDRLRDLCGRLSLTSVYRTIPYNKAIGGASQSFHTKFIAADVIPLDNGVAYLASRAKHLRESGVFKGGIGIYPNFVHIDARGYNADF